MMNPKPAVPYCIDFLLRPRSTMQSVPGTKTIVFSNSPILNPDAKRELLSVWRRCLSESAASSSFSKWCDAFLVYDWLDKGLHRMFFKILNNLFTFNNNKKPANQDIKFQWQLYEVCYCFWHIWPDLNKRTETYISINSRS